VNELKAKQLPYSPLLEDLIVQALLFHSSPQISPPVALSCKDAGLTACSYPLNMQTPPQEDPFAVKNA
jgi:hypothetical protein